LGEKYIDNYNKSSSYLKRLFIIIHYIFTKKFYTFYNLHWYKPVLFLAASNSSGLYDGSVSILTSVSLITEIQIGIYHYKTEIEITNQSNAVLHILYNLRTFPEKNTWGGGNISEGKGRQFGLKIAQKKRNRGTNNRILYTL
jgi:hypothetical protein